jgi:alanine-synthesizing transaminase
MRRIEKSKRLDGVCYDIRGPVMDEARRLEEEGETILKLNIGNPAPFGFHAPEGLRADMAAALASSDGYSDSRGAAASRKAVADYYLSKGVGGIGPERVFMGNGVSEFISICMQALLDPGDEVLIPAPDYPLWTASVALSGGKPVHYRCDEASGWNPDVADIEAKAGPRAKAIVVINPNNPTGALYGEERLAQIAALAARKGLIVFADEIYDRVLYDGATHVPFASIAASHPVFTMNGISKSSFAAGYRGAWMIASGDLGPVSSFLEGVEMLCNMRLCSNVPAQHAIPASLSDSAPIRAATAPGGRLAVQRDLCWEALNAMPGVFCQKPRGAMYCFPRFDRAMYRIEDDKEFVRSFLREKRVLLVQGTGFNWPEHDHARIVFLPEASVLAEALDRLASYLRDRRSRA